MRILFFAHHYPIPYKPYYDTQFADLVAAGHEVTIFAGGRYDSTNEKVMRYGLAEKTRYFPTTLRTVAPRLPSVLRGMARDAGRGVRIIRSVSGSGANMKEDLIHAVRAFSVDSPAPDLCFVHGLGTAVLVPWLRKLFPGTPVAMYYHGGEVPSVRELSAEQVRRTFAEMDVVFTNTQFSRDHAVERGCPADRVEILPVGFTLEDYMPPAGRSYRRNGRLRLLSAGRMSEEKGFGFALEAIRMLVERGITNISYALTGEGYVREQLEKYVADHDLSPYVEFLGRLSTEDVVRAMAEADALLLPSIQIGNWVENQACAVQEAMLMKALVITSRTGGVPESIPPEMQRFVVTPGDPAALADAIEEVSKLSENELRLLGETCRDFVVAGYDIRKLNERLLERVVGVAAA